MKAQSFAKTGSGQRRKETLTEERRFCTVGVDTTYPSTVAVVGFDSVGFRQSEMDASDMKNTTTVLLIKEVRPKQ